MATGLISVAPSPTATASAICCAAAAPSPVTVSSMRPRGLGFEPVNDLVALSLAPSPCDWPAEVVF
jgi:hypothetical protein